MSRTADGTRIACDGDGCHATARLPVALRPFLSPDPDDSATGWFFVARNDAERHYCPDCAPRYLADAVSPRPAGG